MGLFNFFRKNRKSNQEETTVHMNPQESDETPFIPTNDKPKPEEKPTITDEQYENFAELAAQKVIAETKIPSMTITLENETTSIFESKVGGIPYLPKDSAVPLDSDGNQMKLLAQIDCHALEALEDYPHEGILQFWMTTKWAWEEAKVIYHKTVDKNLTEADVISRIHADIHDNIHSFPVNGAYRMQLKLSSESMSCCDYRLKALFCQYFTEISGEYICDPEDTTSEKVYNVFIRDCEERDDAFGHAHKIGGYRYSTQFGDGDYDRYKMGNEINIHADDADVLLFQLVSDYAPINFETRTHDWIKVMWCDAGVGRFTIKRCDLKNCAFENAWFSWDCS